MNASSWRPADCDLRTDHGGPPPRGYGFAGVASKPIVGDHRPEFAWAQACSADGRLRLSFHGELSNAPDLRRQLALPDHLPDHDIMLAAWQRWGVGALSRADGVFALALMAGNELSLFRDRSGLSTLYYYTGQPGQCGFSTHLDALLCLPGTKRRLAMHSLHEYLRFGDIAAPNTLFEDVYSAEPGQVLRWSTGKLEFEPIQTAASTTSPPTNFDAAVEELSLHLGRAISGYLEDSRMPAAFLSGGLDSTLICSLAARERRDLVAITVGFDSPDLDESPLAASIASHLRLRHEVLRFDQRALQSAFERAADGMEQPTADPSLPATILALDHCRERSDAVLDGTGADESIGAMPPRHLRLAVSVGSRLPVRPRLGLARTLRSLPMLGKLAPILDFEHPAEPFIRWGGFERSEIERLCGQSVSLTDTSFYRTFGRYPRGAHFERYSALIDVMPSERVVQAMRIADMRMRFPYTNRQVDTFIRGLPPAFRSQPGQPKLILRALLARHLPREIWGAPKRGFNFPLHQFLMADGASLVREYLDPVRWRRLALLDPDEVSRHARAYLAGDQRRMFRIWALVVISAWLERHIELLR